MRNWFVFGPLVALLLSACSADPPPVPTSIPQATVVPYASGGLGMERAQWEFYHHAPTVVSGGETYENQLFYVVYQDARIGHLEYSYPTPANIAAARRMGKTFIPNDAALIQTYTTTDTERLIDLYHSASLAKRFTSGNPWIGGKPGDFIVLYRQANASADVTSIVLGLGNNP